MTNKEFQELIDNQPVFALSCVSASISKLNEENFDLQDKVYKLEDEIERLNQIRKEVKKLLKEDYFEDGSFENEDKVFELLDLGADKE